MRRFANFYVIAFLVDGGLSVIHEILSTQLVIAGLSSIRNAVAFFVILLTVPLYLLLGIDARIPKKIFLPLIIFVFWASAFAMPIPIFLESNIASLVVSAIQLIFGIGILLSIKKITNGSWLLTQNVFSGPVFIFKKTVLFFLGSVLLLPIVIFSYIFSSLYLAADHNTSGFLRLGLDGLYLTEKEYKKDSKIIRLIGMIHVGEEAYYEDLSTSFSSGRSVLLAEGVTNTGGIISENYSLKKIADLMGLTPQDKMQLKGVLINLDSFEDSSIEDEEKNVLKIVRADIDAKDFSPETVDYLNEIAKHIRNSSSILSAFLSFYQWSTENLSPQELKTINYDLIKRRNDELLNHLDKALYLFDEIIIPWGAMHMPEIEKEIKKKGFVFVRKQERLSFDFSRFDDLFRNMLQ